MARNSHAVLLPKSMFPDCSVNSDFSELCRYPASVAGFRQETRQLRTGALEEVEREMWEEGKIVAVV